MSILKFTPVFASLSLLFPALLKAQASSHGPVEHTSFSVQAHYGSMLASLPKAVYLKDSYSNYLEARILRQKNGSASWHRKYRFPNVGLSVYSGNTGSRKYVGRITGIYPFIEIPIVRKKGWNGSAGIGSGIVWIQKPYDLETNHKNMLIGSALNYTMHLSLKAEAKLARRTWLSAGISFLHMSNGSMKLPNLGINIPAASLGIRRVLTEKEMKTSPVEADIVKKTGLHLFASAGARQSPWIGSKTHFVKTFQFEMSRRVSSTSALAGGLSLFINPALQTELTDTVLIKNETRSIQVQCAAYFQYEQVFGKLSVPLQLGYYFLTKKSVHSFYQNFGVRYRLSDHWSAALYLKTHLGKADYIHAGFGYTF